MFCSFFLKYKYFWPQIVRIRLLRCFLVQKYQVAHKNPFFWLFWGFFFGRTQGMWIFWSQGLNPHHSDAPSCCSDNTGFLACCATWEHLVFLYLFIYFFFLVLYLQHMDIPRLGVNWSYSCWPQP